MSKKSRIVVVGSLHYDIMVSAPHRPRAGETVTGQEWAPKFGGKGGNQAVASAKAGAQTLMVSGVGNDAFADFLLRGLHEGGVNTQYVSQLNDVGSGMSVAIKDQTGDYGAVIVSGANLAIETTPLFDKKLWAETDALILQNEVSEALNIEAARQAHLAGVMVILNAAPYREMSNDFCAMVDVLVVNAIEAEQLSQIDVVDLQTASKAAKVLAQQFGVAIVTAGGDGVALASRGENFTLCAEPVELISTHGAGDCFVGTLSAALASGEELRSAVKMANVAAARHVSTV